MQHRKEQKMLSPLTFLPGYIALFLQCSLAHLSHLPPLTSIPLPRSLFYIHRILKCL